MREQRDTAAEPAAGAREREQAPAAKGAAILRDTGRVEAFSDGVFAVAATLLVLTLQPPLIGTGAGKYRTLADALPNLGPKLAIYAISFSFILIMWVNHHNMFRVIRGTDHTFLLLNGLLLLFVTLVPFPTSLIVDEQFSDADRITAAVMYNATYFLIALAFNALWFYAARGDRLLNVRLDPDAVASTNRRYRLGPFSYLICIGLAFISVPASLAANAALAVFWAWPRPVRSPAQPPANGSSSDE